MEKLFLIAALITFLYCSMKCIEMKFIDKEWKPLKYVIRDAVYVFICSIIGVLVYSGIYGQVNDFFNVITETKTLNPASTQVFTDAPGF
jgi:hypothetical protein